MLPMDTNTLATVGRKELLGMSLGFAKKFRANAEALYFCEANQKTQSGFESIPKETDKSAFALFILL